MLFIPLNLWDKYAVAGSKPTRLAWAVGKWLCINFFKRRNANSHLCTNDCACSNCELIQLSWAISFTFCCRRCDDETFFFLFLKIAPLDDVVLSHWCCYTLLAFSTFHLLRGQKQTKRKGRNFGELIQRHNCSMIMPIWWNIWNGKCPEGTSEKALFSLHARKSRWERSMALIQTHDKYLLPLLSFSLSLLVTSNCQLRERSHKSQRHFVPMNSSGCGVCITMNRGVCTRAST